MWNEIRRKLFHLIGLVYVAGVIFVPRTTYIIALTLAVSAIFAIEQARLRVPAIRSWFERNAGAMFREHERNKMSGVFWMAEGVWTTVLLLKSVPLATTALLYLLFGDAIASLVGKRLRGPKWPKSDKSVIGSVACFFMCLLIGAALLRPNYYDWGGIVMSALVVTIVEFLPLKINDNFTIPVAGALSFLICFGW